MISRFLLAVGLAVLMLVTGVSTYTYLGGRQSKIAAPAQKPTAATPRPQAFALPGTLYLAQSGAIYSLSAGRFHQLTGEAGWSQPSLYGNGRFMVAVKRDGQFSNVFALSRFGDVGTQLTYNETPHSYDVAGNHWSFYPHLSLDEHTMFMSYDQPKFDYDVIMSIWSLPLGAPISRGQLWTNSNDYTGGDVQPIPAPSGGIIYTKYSYTPDSALTGQLWLATHPESQTGYGYHGTALTTPGEDCRSPAFSPDGRELAMICTYQKQVSYLTIASWNGSSLGARQTVISDQMVAEPIWAPDGSGIAYLAPGAPDGPFQLWFLPVNAYHPPVPSPVPVPTPTPGGPYNGTLPSPSPIVVPPPPVVKPIQITTNNGFDATSPMDWSI